MLQFGRRTWITIRATTTCTALVLMIGDVSYAADDCQRNQGDVLESRPGQSPKGEITFSYESRIERYKHATRRHIWCIESDKSNQNIVQFKWGDSKDPGRYFDALVEPGRGSPSIRTDDTKRISASRTIAFTRKNRDDWKKIDVDTLSSQRMGEAFPLSMIVPIQLGGSSRWAKFQTEEGVIDFEALSKDRSALLDFLKEQSSVNLGSTLLITIPTRLEVAELLRKSAYEKYNESDFVRATASFFSTVSYGGGEPYIMYTIGLVSETPLGSKLPSLLSDGLISFRITQTPDQPLRTELPKGVFAIKNPEPIVINKTGFPGPLVISPMRVEVTFAKDQPIGRFDAAILSPK
jgi:hypothetical protein